MKLRTVSLDQTLFYTYSRSQKYFIHPAKTRAPLPYYKSHSVNSHLLSEAKNTPKPASMLCSSLHRACLGRRCCCWHSTVLVAIASRRSKQYHLHMFTMIIFYPLYFALSLPSSPVATILFLHQLAQ